MKRILPLLTILLLLCGCGNAKPEPVETTTATTEPVIVKLYMPQSAAEQQTSGAVRAYAPEKVQWITPVCGNVLLATGDTNTLLTLVTGTDGEVVATRELPILLGTNSIWQGTTSGFAYYDSTSKTVVFLNLQLEEAMRLQLPEDISGEPAIAQDCSQVFYCQGQTVYALDVNRKIARPVRTNTCEKQTLAGCYFNGAIIGCKLTDKAGKTETLYLSGENGELLHKDNGIRKVYTGKNSYFALRNEGILEQYIYGTTDTAPNRFAISDMAWGALELGGIVGQNKTDDAVNLSFYNLKKTATVSLPRECSIQMVAADDSTEGIWLLTEKGQLLHWSVTASTVTDETDYMDTIYTEENPDVEGLKICQKRVDALNKELGVAIRIWEKALTSNETFRLTTEYQPEAIDRALTELETVLRKFPKNFLYKSVARQIRICIVRDIDGAVTSAYHWYDGDPFIILSAGVDMEKAFLDAFAYIVDIHILGNSPHLDTWESLNPAGFAYGPEVTVMAYLEGETRAFADRKGMQSLIDDRAQVFYQAMQEDNAEVFASDTMQAKLKLLCLGIRDAWRLEKSKDTFLWEQYLEESLAYQK